MSKDLSKTPAWELDKFIKDHILVDTGFLNKVRADIDCVCAFLKDKRVDKHEDNERDSPKDRSEEGHKPKPPVWVSRVMMNGSFDSDSDLKDTPEVNITVFLTNLNSFNEVHERSEEFKEEIKKQLCKLPEKEDFQLCYEVQNPKKPSPSFVSFKLTSPELQQEVECSVWLAREVLGGLSNNQQLDTGTYNKIYAELIDECLSFDAEEYLLFLEDIDKRMTFDTDIIDECISSDNDIDECISSDKGFSINKSISSEDKKGQFHLSFTELQQDFLKNYPPKLRNLICLVKYWHQLCMKKLKKPVPPRYALELLTIYAWESGSGVDDFNTAEGFRTVLELITKHESLCMYWTVYYDFQHPKVSDYLHRQLQNYRPIILDPADPTRNIADCTYVNWYFLACLAKEWLDYPCCKDRDDSPVQSWKVLEDKHCRSTFLASP
ncbi:2'-5'-oligoadenylate synthase 1A-like [Arvicanthis niloticus]|uniref:2'-5'-oligoadenylate synthase 1A-like n=1 Tax=Arvicanthis niloticus TaxID=61156 RepID=UPI0014867970|nr:2'-5'-oligoadenylate synthase 1A-like [Arvicanthis niloticus]